MSNNNDKGPLETSEGLVDPKFIMEALTSEMRRLMRSKIEQVHEWMDWMETAHFELPHNVTHVRRKEKV